MFWRVTHWSSRANFRWLIKVDSKKVIASYNQCLRAGKFTPSRRNDLMLAGLLMGRPGEESVRDLIKWLSPFSDFYPAISKLVRTYNEKKAPKGSERRMGWYMEDTCIEVHKLLISAVVAYTNALRIFKRLQRKQVDYADQLWQAAYLLWRISDSQILHHHLRLLNFANELAYPIRGMDQNLARDLDVLYGYITAEGHVKVDNSGDHREAEANENEDGNGNDNNENKNKDKNNKNNKNGEDGEDDNNKNKGEGEDDDQIEECLIITDPDLEKTYLRWIQLHATYWKAQDIVVSSLDHPTSPENYEISVVKAKYPLGKDRKMLNWTTLIRSLSLPNLNPEIVIATIKMQILLCIKEWNCHPIFKKYKGKKCNPRYFTGNLHAEVLLALILLELQDDEIVDHFKVCS